MPLLSLMNSRHRVKKTYFLNLNGTVDVDYVVFDFNYIDLNIPSVGDYYIEATFDTADLLDNTYQPIFGRLTAGTTNQAWGFLLNGSGIFIFQSYAPVSNNTIPNFLTVYPNQVITVKGKWTATGSELYINDVLISTKVQATRPADSVGYVFINGTANSVGQNTPRTDLMADFQVYNVDINGNKLPINEGKGFPMKFDNGEIVNGVTSNASPVTHWNNDVWTEYEEVII